MNFCSRPLPVGDRPDLGILLIMRTVPRVHGALVAVSGSSVKSGRRRIGYLKLGRAKRVARSPACGEGRRVDSGPAVTTLRLDAELRVDSTMAQRAQRIDRTSRVVR